MWGARCETGVPFFLIRDYRNPNMNYKLINRNDEKR